MALVVNDRVKETSTTTGTGTFTLDGAVTGFETFSSAIGNTNTTYYAIEIPNTTEFEVGLGTVSAGQLARTTVISSSNSDALVDFSAGTKNVFCTLPASKAVIEDASNNVTLPADLTVDTNTLHVDSSNNRVGIGTTSPTQALTIGGDANSVSISSNDFDLIKLGPRATSGANLDRSIFQMYSGGIETNRLDAVGNTFINGGNVGIGTTSPSSLLHLSSSDPQITITDTDGTGSQVIKAVGDDLVLDSPSNIKLDADSAGNIWFMDGGTTFLKVYKFGGTKIEANVADEDLIFKVNDGGSFIDALTFDSSEAGAATFNDKIILGANKVIEFGDAGETISGDGTNLNIVSSNALGIDVPNGITLDSGSGGTILRAGGGTTYGTLTSSSGDFSINQTTSDKDIIFTGNDGGSFFTALTLDMSDEGFAEFNSKIRVEADSSTNAILVKGRSADDIGTIKFTANDGSSNQGELSARSSVFIFNTPTQTNFRINNTDKLTLTSSQINLKDNVFVDANKAIEFGDAGESISGDGTDLTISTSNDVTIDSARDIILDGDQSIKLLDGGAQYASISNSSGVSFTSQISDNNILLRGNDGGSFITALTLDMSEAGDAIFNSNIFLGDNKKANFGAGNDLQIYHDSSDSFIDDVGTGDLKIRSTFTRIIDISNNNVAATFTSSGVNLRHSNSVKLTTSSTGIDVTGTAVTDGLTVAGNVSVDGGTIKLDGNYPTGTNNVAMGDTALDSIGTGGAGHNVAIGHAALTADDTGTGNVGIGAFALTSTVTGNYSTAIGQEALKVNTASWNNAIGFQSMLTSVGGEKNIAMGFWSLKNLGSNDKNVAIGHEAGINLTGGDNNIIIGHNAQAASATTSNQITLGDANITSLRIPGLASGASSGDVLTYDGTDITLSAPTGVSAGFSIAMAIAL